MMPRYLVFLLPLVLMGCKDGLIYSAVTLVGLPVVGAMAAAGGGFGSDPVSCHFPSQKKVVSMTHGECAESDDGIIVSDEEGRSLNAQYYLFGAITPPKS